MKGILNFLLGRSARALVVAGLLCSGSASSATLVLPPPPNNDADGFVRGTWGSPAGVGVAPENSYLTVDIQPGGGPNLSPVPPIPPGRYATWCFDTDTIINPGAGTLYGGYLYSTSATGTPLQFIQPFNHLLPDHPNVKKDAATWNRINYLINHRRLAHAGFVPTMWEVQHAIYRLLGQLPPPAPPYPTVRSTVVQSLIDTATANAEVWRPGCGDKVAVVFNIDVNWDDTKADVQLIFLEVPILCLGDFVWKDNNGNGLQDAGEPGIPGVTVNLKNSANQIIATTTTDASGKYEFSGVFAGTYTVEVDESSPALSGWVPTLSNVGGGANAATDSNGSPTTVTLTTASDFTLDFGYVPAPASLAGFVYYDANNDGLKDSGEAGIAGVTVTLTGSNDLGPVNLTTTTSGTGAYSFPNLRPGTYTIKETQPGAYLDGKDTIGTPGGVSIVNDEFGTIVLGPGVHGQNNNFGEVLPASLAGFVYHDVDNDGIFDSGEAGIATLVTLTGTNDLGQPVNLSTTSDGTTGAYSFPNLRPGTYVITETQPAGYLDGKDTIGTPGGTTGADKFTSVVLAAGVNGQNNNFGEILAASLAGFVYYDVNNNGLMESGEAGIATLVTLTGTDDLGNVVSLSTTSDGTTGAYSFPNLRPGTYVITETQPVGYLDGKDTIGTPGGTTGSDNFSAIVLAAGVNGQNNNFGEILSASLAGFVYYDANNNGLKEAGETGIATTVTLTGTDDLGNPVSLSTTSDGTTGAYSFTNLRPGTYVITESQPVSYLDGKDTIGTPGGTTGADTFTAIVLPAGVNGQNNNFGEILASSLAGFVYYDINDNGIREAGEPGIATTVTLTGTDDLGNPVNLSTTSDGTTGAYSFPNLRPGNYVITESQPAGYLDGKDTIGTPGGTTGADTFTAIVLPAGVNGQNNNFGEVLPGSLGNRVWHDANKNGLQDNGEAGIDGVKVTLFTSAGAQLGSVTTSGGGLYRFDNLTPGIYYVTFDQSTLPAGYVLTTRNTGSDDTVDSDANPADGKSDSAVVLTGAFNDTVDAGAYFLTGSLGNRVWHDANKNGVQDSGETGLDGVKVTLFTGAGLQVGAPVTTAGGGFYRFDDLAPGTYYVVFDKSTLPSGYVFTAQNSGSDDTADSDANIVSGKSEGNATVVGGQFNDTVDAGAYLVPPLTLACAGGTGSVGVAYSSSLVASGGTAPYAFSITGGSLPPGLTLNPTTGAITGTPTSAGTFTYTAQVTDSTGGGARTTTANCSITVGTTPCVPTTFTFSGNTAGNGTPGNIRQYTLNGISVKVSAFSRTKASAGSVWSTAYLGSFPGGLGVTDGSEDGSGNSHTVDNVGRDNFVLFEFSQPVVINRAYLGYVAGDSDLTAWVGNANDPFNNHLTLSNAVLASLTAETNTTTSTQARWATLNAGGVSGNVLIIAADLDDTTPDDYFKIAQLELCQPATPTGALSLVKTANPTSAAPYQPVTYTYTVKNTGNTTLTNIVVKDDNGTPDYPADDFTVGTIASLAPGATATLTAQIIPVVSTSAIVNGNSVPAGSVIVTLLPNGDVMATYLQSFSVNDNTYGTGQIGWPGGNKKFSQLVGSDKLEFRFFDKNKNVVLDFYLDCIAAATSVTIPGTGQVISYPSGYGTMGPFGGDGSMVAGDPKNIVTFSTSISDNLNHPLNVPNKAALIVNSPTSLVGGNVVINTSSPSGAPGGWDPINRYTVVVKGSAFGASGFGSVSIPDQHNSPSKLGVNQLVATPTASTVVNKAVATSGTLTATATASVTIGTVTPPTGATGSIGSLVWQDNDADGIQDAGELGIAGVTVKLLNSSGVVIATDVTDGGGNYLFEGLNAGTYKVVVTTPSGYTASPSGKGSNRAIDSNGSPATVTLATNSSVDLTVDFGFVPPVICTKPLLTYTQGGWGSKPKGNNPGTVLKNNFNAVYPGGSVSIGSGSKILTFTSAAAIANFLPQGGTPGTLSASATNPSTSSAGVLAGQLLAARLNVDFSSAGKTAPGLDAKKVVSGPLAGKTVKQVIDIANSVISGGALPSGLTLSILNDVLTAINENYDEGTNNDGFLY